MNRGAHLGSSVAVAAAILGLAATSACAADNSISLSAAPSPLAASEPASVTASGVETSLQDADFATFKAAGGTCAATPGADSGSPLLVDTDTSADANSSSVDGPWAFTSSASMDAADRTLVFPSGAELLCGWLTDGTPENVITPADVLATTQTTVSVAAVTGSFTSSGPLAVIRKPSDATWSIQWTANAPIWLTVVVESRYAPQPLTCATRPSLIGNQAYTRYAEDLTGDPDQDEPAFPVGPEAAGNPDLSPTGTYQVALPDSIFSAGVAETPGPFLGCAWLTADDAGTQVLYGPISRHWVVLAPGQTGVPPAPWSAARCTAAYDAWRSRHRGAGRVPQQAEKRLLRGEHRCTAT